MPKSRRGLRRLFWSTAILIVLVVVVAALLPSILSSAVVRGYLLARINESIPGRVHFTGLELSWSTGPTIVGAELIDPDGERVARFDRLSTEASLIGLALGDYNLGTVEIEDLELDLVRDEQGNLNLAQVFGPGEPGEPRTVEQTLRELQLPASLRVELRFRDAQLTLRDPSLGGALACTPLRVNLTLPGPAAPLSLTVECQVRQENQLDGDLLVRAQVHGFDEEGRLQLQRASGMLTVEADWARGTSDRGVARQLSSWLGRTFKLESRVESSETGTACELEIQSERLTARGAGTAAWFGTGPERRFGLTRPFEVTCKLDPRLIAAEDALELPEELPIELKVESFEGPIEDWTGLGVKAALRLGEGRARVLIDGKPQAVAWRNWSADLASKAIGESVSVRLAGGLSAEGGEGSVSLEAKGEQLREATSVSDAIGRLDGALHVVDFPLAPIDRLIGRVRGEKGRLLQAIGDRLALKVSSERPTEGSRQYAVQARAAHLTAEGALSITGERLHGRGVRLRWALKPEVVDGLAGPDTRLGAKVPIDFGAESFALKLGSFDPRIVSVERAKLTIGDGRVDLPGRGRMEWSGLEAEIHAPKLSEAISIRAGGDLRQGNESGRLDVQGEIRALWSDAGEFQPGKFQGELTAKAGGLPLRPISRALGLEDRLVEALGDRCDIDLAATGGAEATDARLRLKSPLIDARIPARIGEELQVGSDATVRYRLRPGLVSEFDAPISLDKDVVLDLKPTRVRVPLPASGEPFRIRESDLDVTLETADANLSGLPRDQRVQLRKVKARITSRPGDRARLDCSLQLEPKDRLLTNALGGPTEVKLEASSDWEDAELAAVQLQSALLKLSATGRLENERFVLTGEPALVDYELRPALMREFGEGETLASPAMLKLSIARLELPLAEFDPARIVAKATADVARLALRGARGGADVRIDNLALTAELGRDLVLAGSGRVAGAAQPFDLQARLDGWGTGALDRSTPARVQATLQRFPLSLLGSLPGVDPETAVLLGREADLMLDADFPAKTGSGAETRREASVHVRTQHLDLTADCEIAEEVVLTRPAVGRCTLTPEAWAKLAGPQLKLRRPAEVAVRLDTFRISPAFDWETLALKGTATVAQLSLRDAQSGAALEFRDLRLATDSPRVGRSLRVDLSGRSEASTGPGRVDGRLQVSNLAAGTSDRSFATDGELRLDQVPFGPLDQMLDLNGYGVAVIGPTVSVDANWQMRKGTGPAQLKVRSNRARADVAARLTKEGLRLDKPVEAELALTKELGELVLPKLGPLFRGVESTSGPVRMWIDSKGFLVPLQRMDIRRVQVGTARVDIGQVVLNNKWLTEVLFAVTRAKGEGERTNAWFTPLELEMKNGVVRYSKRLDLLTQETMHLSSWGEVDLGRNRINLVFAFMADALRHHLHVSRAREGDALRVPIRGTIDDPKIKLDAALADLAKIQLREKALAKIKDPLVAALSRGILEGLFDKTLRGEKMPEASVHPLPWREERPNR